MMQEQGKQAQPKRLAILASLPPPGGLRWAPPRPPGPCPVAYSMYEMPAAPDSAAMLPTTRLVVALRSTQGAGDRRGRASGVDMGAARDGKNSRHRCWVRAHQRHPASPACPRTSFSGGWPGRPCPRPHPPPPGQHRWRPGWRPAAGPSGGGRGGDSARTAGRACEAGRRTGRAGQLAGMGACRKCGWAARTGFACCVIAQETLMLNLNPAQRRCSATIKQLSPAGCRLGMAASRGTQHPHSPGTRHKAQGRAWRAHQHVQLLVPAGQQQPVCGLRACSGAGVARRPSHVMPPAAVAAMLWPPPVCASLGWRHGTATRPPVREGPHPRPHPSSRERDVLEQRVPAAHNQPSRGHLCASPCCAAPPRRGPTHLPPRAARG